MPATTAKTIPYASGVDGANTIDTTMQALAQWVDDNLSSFTTTQRDAFVSALKWNGRIIRNTTTNRHEWWDASTSTWRALASSRRAALLLSTL